MTTPSRETFSAPFPIVAIGCSAGGLQASMELLRGLPLDSAIAIVLLQHLDPSRPSGLSELLSKAGTMPTEIATDGELLPPGRVYVVPPHAITSVADGR